MDATLPWSLLGYLQLDLQPDRASVLVSHTDVPDLDWTAELKNSAVSSTLFVLVGVKRCASYGFAFVNFLHADRAEKFRIYFFQYAKMIMPGIQQ